MTLVKTPLQFGLAALLLAALSGTALAGGFSIREQSAEGLGNDFAGLAAGSDGLSSMFWNPATLSQHNSQGFVTELNGSLILPHVRGTSPLAIGLNQDSGNIGDAAVVPSAYASYAVNDQLTLGLAITAPLGLSTTSDTWIGSPTGHESSVMSLNVSPMLAYKPADWISLGIGLQAQYMKVKLSSADPAVGADFFSASGDDVGFGVVGGILLQPSDVINIGVGFRSSVSHTLKGDGMLLPAAILDNPISAPFKSPEAINVGVALKASDKLTLKAGGEWNNWSRFKSLDISFDGTPVTLSTPEAWKDSWFFSLGGDYAMTDALTLRAGLGYEISPVTPANLTSRLPDGNRFSVSVGAAYKVADNFTANIGYSHLFMEDTVAHLIGAGALPPSTANFKSSIDLVAASAVIDW